jgi:uncharacterized membrane protein YfcA
VLVLVLEGNVNWKYGAPMAVGGLVGGYIGESCRIAQTALLSARSSLGLGLRYQGITSGSCTPSLSCT